MWAVSVLQPQKLQVRCVHKTYIIALKPPLQIVEIPDGCEGFSDHFSIPPRSGIANSAYYNLRSPYFLSFNLKYEIVENHLFWGYCEEIPLSEQQKQDLLNEISYEKPMDMSVFRQHTKRVNTNYPWTLSSKTILIILILTGVVYGLTYLGVAGYLCYQRKLAKNETRNTKDIFKRFLMQDSKSAFGSHDWPPALKQYLDLSFPYYTHVQS